MDLATEKDQNKLCLGLPGCSENSLAGTKLIASKIESFSMGFIFRSSVQLAESARVHLHCNCSDAVD